METFRRWLTTALALLLALELAVVIGWLIEIDEKMIEIREDVRYYGSASIQ